MANGSDRPERFSATNPPPLTGRPQTWRRIDPAEVPVVPSPSGLPTQHLVSATDGATGTFLGQQWLAPGDRVLFHTHPVEETLMFLSGSGEATLGDPAATVPLAAGTCLLIPAGVPHGFRNTGETTLHVLVVFPIPAFAPTDLREPSAGAR